MGRGRHTLGAAGNGCDRQGAGHSSYHPGAGHAEALILGGFNYLGFCAGAWLAVSPVDDGVAAYGVGIVEAPVLEPNFLGREGRTYALTAAL